MEPMEEEIGDGKERGGGRGGEEEGCILANSRQFSFPSRGAKTVYGRG